MIFLMLGGMAMVVMMDVLGATVGILHDHLEVLELFTIRIAACRSVVRAPIVRKE